MSDVTKKSFFLCNKPIATDDDDVVKADGI